MKTDGSWSTLTPRRLGLALLAFATFTSSSAAADPSKEDVARADALFRDAQTFIQKGQTAEACPKFAESQRLDPANGTLLNLALCHDKEGRSGTAYRELQELLALMSGSKNPDDRERSRVASDRLRGIEKKLSRVSLDISGLPPNTTLTLDGDKVTDPAAPLIVDPGPHTVVAEAKPRRATTTTFEVKEPGPKTVKVAPPEEDKPEPLAPPPKETKAAESPSFWTGQRVVGAVVVGVGVAGVGVGTVFGLKTFSSRNERDTHCRGTVCDAEGIRLHDDAKSSATLSSIAFGVGAAALVVGTYLLVTGSKAAPKSSDTAWLSPLFVGAAGFGLRGF